MAANGRKMSKSDAQTIAQGEQLTTDVDNRLRSASGKTYHAEIVVQTDSLHQKVDRMGSIEEVLNRGGIDHAQPANGESAAPHAEGCCSSQVIALINKLQETVDSMNSKLNASTAFQDKTEKRLSSLEKAQAAEKKEVAYINDSVQQYQVKVDILSDIVIKQHREIEELKAQMTDTQARGMKCNLTISGIPQAPNENCIAAVQKFIVEKLQITDKLIPIDQAYRFGTGKVKTMLVVLRHWSDKAIIFDHVKNLKGLKVEGVQCFVSSQLPEALNEKRRKNYSCMAENKKQPTKHRLPYSIKQGELLFKDQPIIPKVHPPFPRDLLSLPDPELERINAIKITEGLCEEREESTFRGYAISATGPEQINDAYKKMKLMHGQATHIACAYKLSKWKPPYQQDGCDDYEHGSSRVMLQAIQDSGMSDVAVFMVRYYGGKKLGPLRFDLIKKVSESALTLHQVSLQEVHSSRWDEDPFQDQEEKDSDQSLAESSKSGDNTN